MKFDSDGNLLVAGVGLGGNSTSSTGLTDAQLRAAPVPVTPSLAAGAATAAKQDVAAASLGSIDTKTPALAGGAVPVAAAARACTGRQTIALAANTVTTLTVPGSSVAANIQADGGTVRITQDGTAPTASIGTRIDDGVIYPVDTALASVKLFSTAACNVQVCYFDRA